jgi:hypothetical protein
MSWFLHAPLSLLVTLTGILFAPLLALCVQKSDYLPGWLSWYQTPDAPAIGDAAYRSNQMKGITSRWWIATCWLARNPAYGFDHLVGARISASLWPPYQSWGDEFTTNAPLHEGWVYRRIGPYWQFYFVKKLTATKCLKLNLGWKLWGKLEAGQVRQLVCTASPFTKIV